MNRRNLLSLLGTNSSMRTAVEESAPVVAGLEAYTGEWSQVQAAHLLRRTMFGPNLNQIEDVAKWGLDESLERLMKPPATLVEGPINPGRFNRGDEQEEVTDVFVSTGQPWVRKVDGIWEMAPFPRDAETFVNVQTYRTLSLYAWKTKQILNEEISVWEKMTLFWHNHFAVAGENSGMDFLYTTTLFENALGNFRDLVKEITLDPSMLGFLNGNGSTRLAPNENYARELFELFTIGKGPLAGPGDYTHYTEADILEAARALTGWAVRAFALQDIESGVVKLSQSDLVVFNQHAHDTGIKRFSKRFKNMEIGNEGSEEYTSLVDMIFRQKECARFIARKLYRWFVYYAIDENIERLVIEPLAEIIIEHDYELAPALETLLKSAHFFESASFGQMIKNPYDFVMSILKPLELQPPPDTAYFEHFNFHLGISQFFIPLQMAYFSPPSVSGWKAYYQEPLFYRTWINASTLNFRATLLQGLILGPGGTGLDILGLIDDMEDSQEPNKLIDGLSILCFPQIIAEEQKTYLKDVLIPGLPDFEWTVEYESYRSDSEDLELRNSIDQKLRRLLHAMMSMPEFYLS